MAHATKADYVGVWSGLNLAPFSGKTEIIGPIAPKVFITPSSEDADVFLVLILYDPDGVEVLVEGATEPRHSLSQG